MASAAEQSNNAPGSSAAHASDSSERAERATPKEGRQREESDEEAMPAGKRRNVNTRTCENACMHENAVNRRPIREGARKRPGAYDENPRKRAKRQTGRHPKKNGVIHMEKQSAQAGPFKYLIKIGPRVIERAEESQRERTSVTRGTVFDDMG